MPGLGKAVGKTIGFLGGKALSPSLPTFSPSPTITTPAFRLSGTAGGAVDLTRLAGPQRFTDILADLKGVQAEVKPGFGRFTEAAVTAIREAKDRALGNARDILARRRVAGSSFAVNQLANLERAFAQDEELVRSNAILKEIETTTQLIDARFKTQLSGFELDLKELGVAAGLSQSILGVMSEQAGIDKQIAAQSIAGTGTALGDIGGEIGDFFEGIFKPSTDRIREEAAQRFGFGRVATI